MAPPPRRLLAALLLLASAERAAAQPVYDSGNGFTWSVYYPNFRPLPLEDYIETNHTWMVQPSLALGGNSTHPVLATQDFNGHPLLSRDGGLTWAPMCTTGLRPAAAAAAAAAGAPAVTPFTGRAAGIGFVSDGSVLLGTNIETAATCGTWPYAANCSLQVFLFKVRADATGECSWGPPHQLPTLAAKKPCDKAKGQHCDNVGGDATNRFHETPAGEIYYTGTNLRVASPGGLPLPPEEQYDYSVCYKSTDLGKTFAPAGVIGSGIAEVDILPLPASAAPAAAATAGGATGAGGGTQYLLAALRYQASLRPTLDHYASFYKQTAISHSTDGA